MNFANNVYIPAIIIFIVSAAAGAVVFYLDVPANKAIQLALLLSGIGLFLQGVGLYSTIGLSGWDYFAIVAR